MAKEMITVAKTARVLKVGLNHTYALLYAGRLPGARKVGRSWQIPREAVMSRKRARA